VRERQEVSESARAFVVAVTRVTEALVPTRGVGLQAAPWRVGRDRRDHGRRSFRWLRERRRASLGGPNDLYLPEPISPHRLSRRHFLIAFDPEAGRFFLEDLQSACGTCVNGTLVGGGRRGGRRFLRSGDLIEPGGTGSAYAFRFVLDMGPQGFDGPRTTERPAEGRAGGDA
jgi:pSer/pThr/pTyr-binding forkhead associated (FHA) protein